MSITPTLETALADLPAKPRVHELSKRIGITNKELLAALAERGLTIKSASASVPPDVARSVIEAFLAGAPADTAGAGAAGADQGDGGVAGSPAHHLPPTAAGTRPLFLPPEITIDDSAPADPAADEDTGGPDETGPGVRSGSGRRRRGRSGRRNSPPTDEQEPSADEPGVAAAVADDPAESADDESDSAPADDDAGATDSASRGRRRRRGRRGRGRIAGESDEGGDSTGRDDDDDQGGPDGSDAAEATEVDGSEAGSADRRPRGSGDDSEESDADSGSAGSRRRRRRRRRSTGEDGAREDDPDNTVVHVREPRSAGAGSAPSSGSSGSSAASEVQGVRGSTRLEAKRQRRRDSRDTRRRPQILTEAEFLARRESVERVMAVRQRGDLAQVALLEDRVLVEHFVSRAGSDSMIGSVFLGKVQNVLPSMEAAFIDIGRGRNAVLYAGEVNWDAAGLAGKARRIETALSSGDTILAQVSKDPIGHKGARLTTQISLPGRFLVYVPGGGATGISRKLPDTERKRLKSILDRIVPQDAGVIIRTAAEGISEAELARDVERLKSQWEEISRRAEARTGAPTVLYAEPGTLLKVVRDLFNSDITRLVVDGDDAYEPVADYITAIAPELANRLSRFERPAGGGDVFDAYRIDEQIAKALERKVHLPSGGSLVIDRTEAMTVVDVNTGKYTGSGGNLEETVTKNNLEAAEEIVRQLRLRDIGGIIVVDFIDMVLESNRELVLRRLTECLGRDRTRHQVAEVTSLGLVQMTRKRMGTGLLEAFSEPCPHCGGRGILLHDAPIDSSEGDDAAADRPRGKSRRGRGRDGDRGEDVVTRVQHALGRKPDPRGPKPPPIGSTADIDDDDLEVSSHYPAAEPTHLPTPGQAPEPSPEPGADTAAADGARGAAATEESARPHSEPSGGPDVGVDEQPGPGSAVDPDSTVDVGYAVVMDAVAPGTDSVDGDVVDGDVVDDDVVDDGGLDAERTDAPVYDQPPVDTRRPWANRRAAGRPAGAPVGAVEAVDIIVRPVPDHGAATDLDPSAVWVEVPGDGRRAVSEADGDRADGDRADGEGADGERTDGERTEGDRADASSADAPNRTPAAPPRRRAASRPAGPAAGSTVPDTVEVPQQTDQPVG